MGFQYCRYHYNVTDSRLQQHVEKGREDGLFISCVASSVNLWAIIMDAGTGFTSQVYQLSPMFFNKVGNSTFSWQFCYHIFKYAVISNLISCKLFHQEWITEQWDKSYYITSIAGACNGSSLVIMSQGK